MHVLKSKSKRQTASKLVMFLVALLASTGGAVAAGPGKTSGASTSPYQQGVLQFKQGAFAQACNSFALASKNSPADSNAAYYYALSLQYCKRFAEAKSAYSTVISRFPGTAAASLSLTALNGFQGGSQYRSTQTVGQPSSSSDGSRDPSLDTFPDECYVPFENVGNTLYINASINRRPIKMIFDTGAEFCAFGNNHLADLGIPAPTGRPAGQCKGVGLLAAQNYWDVPVDITVGAMTRRNFIINSQQRMDGEPLLGQTFFQDFRYTIDNGARTIHFVRKNKAGLYRGNNNARDTNAVPFRRVGNEMVVDVYINGRRTSMIFDTGASVTSLSMQQLKEVGLTVPADAQDGIVNGVSGPSPAKIFNVQRMQCGPIDMRDVQVYLPASERNGPGLLGQTFYQSWQYTIDYDGSVINFLRR